MESAQFRYDFCICCVSSDSAHAERLARSLEQYRISGDIRLQGEALDYRRILRDFKGERFDTAVREALRECRQLILICSPAVRDEKAITDRLYFFEGLRSMQAIIPVLVQGEPEESLPAFFIRRKKVEHILPDMTTEERIETVEPVAADLRGKTERERKDLLRYETVRIAATSLDMVPDMLVRRHRAARRKRIVTVAAAAGAICLALAAIFGWYGYQAKKAADIARQQTTETIEAANRLFIELPEIFKDDPEALSEIDRSIEEAKDALEALGSSAAQGSGQNGDGQ